jgi:hypothetical protein
LGPGSGALKRLNLERAVRVSQNNSTRHVTVIVSVHPIAISISNQQMKVVSVLAGLLIGVLVIETRVVGNSALDKKRYNATYHKHDGCNNKILFCRVCKGGLAEYSHNAPSFLG